MKIEIETKYIADDNTVFDNEYECAEYEKSLPLKRLLDEIHAAVADNPDFADKIEELGAKLARDRRSRGELKRGRRPTETPAPVTHDETSLQAPFAPGDDDPSAVDIDDLERKGYFDDSPEAPCA